MDFSTLGKMIVVFGAVLVGLGLFIWLVGKTGLPFGNLPGDIQMERPGYAFHFPVVTCIVLSVAITIILNVVLWFFRR